VFSFELKQSLDYILRLLLLHVCVEEDKLDMEL
jgi:hypothetical protein